MDISFYKATTQPVERVLPKLLEKVRAVGKRALVRTGSEERVEELSHILWTYAQQSFLSHGTLKDGRAEHQPIWLTCAPENLNNASVLVLMDGCCDARGMDAYERCLYLYNGTVDGSEQMAQSHREALTDQGHTVTTWHQGDTGQWTKD